jgi:hypothetical protein
MREKIEIKITRLREFTMESTVHVEQFLFPQIIRSPQINWGKFSKREKTETEGDRKPLNYHKNKN